MRNGFIVSAENLDGIFFNSFNEVQNYMNELERKCIINNVLVQLFKESNLVKEITYNYDGNEWKK